MKKLACLALMALLSACADEPPAPVAIVTDPPSPIKLDVLTVSLLNNSAPQAENSPYAANDFQPTITAGIRQWASQNLVAAGSTGQAVVTISDASLTSQDLPKDDDWFTREQGSKYVAHAKVYIRAEGRAGNGNMVAEASRYVTLPENPTKQERQNAYATVFNGLMHDLGDKLSSGILRNLSPFVVLSRPVGAGAH